MSRVITFAIFLFNLYLSYKFGMKKEGVEFIDGFKNIRTDSGRKFVGNSTAVYLLVVNIFLLSFLILDIMGIQYISNIGVWDIYFYIFITITIIFILILNIFLKNKRGN